MKNAYDLYLKDIIKRSLAEDLGREGDITSRAMFDARRAAKAVIKSKSAGVLSGVQVIRPLFERIDPSVSVQLYRTNGDRLKNGTRIATLTGPIRAILAGERIALNFLQHLSGIATLTRDFVDRVAHTRARILDTRKTTPTLRLLEKEAVVHGGGVNHRFGLFDMVLIKHTHVRAAHGVGEALLLTQQHVRRRGAAIKIEVETRSAREFNEALACGPDRIMLDNMSIRDMAACVRRAKKCNSRAELEASGNVSLETVAPIAGTGVDFISIGSITHSAPALDIHLVIE
jgi:nicotinate-nucleotide pyrophosphorylase (carboxylating)